MSSPSAPPTEKPEIDLTHGGPPPEVLDQMARADEINTRLRRSGHEICFALSADGRSLQIELRDGDGRVVRILSLSEATDIAEGGAVGD